MECEKGGEGGDTGDVNTLCARGVAAARALINTRPASGQRRSFTNCCHRRKLTLSPSSRMDCTKPAPCSRHAALALSDGNTLRLNEQKAASAGE